MKTNKNNPTIFYKTSKFIFATFLALSLFNFTHAQSNFERSLSDRLGEILTIYGSGSSAQVNSARKVYVRNKESDAAVVRGLQTFLNQNGANIRVDGSYGKDTKNAVMAFQRANGLKADGVIGVETARAIQNSPESTQVVQKVAREVEQVRAVTPVYQSETARNLAAQMRQQNSNLSGAANSSGVEKIQGRLSESSPEKLGVSPAPEKNIQTPWEKTMVAANNVYQDLKGKILNGLGFNNDAKAAESDGVGERSVAQLASNTDDINLDQANKDALAAINKNSEELGKILKKAESLPAGSPEQEQVLKEFDKLNKENEELINKLEESVKKQKTDVASQKEKLDEIDKMAKGDTPKSSDAKSDEPDGGDYQKVPGKAIKGTCDPNVKKPIPFTTQQVVGHVQAGKDPFLVILEIPGPEKSTGSYTADSGSKRELKPEEKAFYKQVDKDGKCIPEKDLKPKEVITNAKIYSRGIEQETVKVETISVPKP